MNGEGSLDADPEAHLAHGKGLPDARALPADDVALEHLDPLPVALHDPDMDLQIVAGPEIGDVRPQTGAVNEIGGVHGERAPREQPERTGYWINPGARRARTRRATPDP